MISQRGKQEERQNHEPGTSVEYCGNGMESNRTESNAEKFNLAKCNNLKWKDITIATKL